MSGLKAEAGKEGRFELPAWLKLILMIALIILTSVTQSRLVIMACGAIVLVRLALLPAESMPGILKTALFAGILAAILYTPAVIMDHGLLGNGIRLVV
ncbi:MAG: hypothetical protein J6I83_04405, partial [Firmicutes bacterium]|nr:hypothetical protein [Bacillota bacterium]